MMYVVEFQNVLCLYGDVWVVDGVSIGICDGEFFLMLGLFGLGKIICLWLIVGFEQFFGGIIYIFGQLVSELLFWQWDVNIVFQDYVLFFYMLIFDNVVYGLMVKGMVKKVCYVCVQEVLEKVVFGFVYYCKFFQFFGGQWQWVVIVWVLVNQLWVLLFDELLGVLDLKLCEQMQVELKKLQQLLGIIFIFVIYDQSEVLLMLDCVVVFNNGCIEQVDVLQDFYLYFRIVFVVGFVGIVNVFVVEVV